MERGDSSSEEDCPTVLPEPQGQALRSLSLAVGVLPFQCDLSRIQARLTCYLREKTVYTSLEDLESSCAALCMSLREQLPDWSPSLKPLLAVHPLLSVACSEPNPALLSLAEDEIRRLRTHESEIVTEYQWIMRALELLGDLSVAWGLITLEDFGHRDENAAGSILAACSRLDSLVFQPEVMCISLAPGPIQDDQLKIWCVRVHRAAEETLTTVAKLAPGPECSKIYEATDSLNNTAKHRAHSGISLSLPSWWQCGFLLRQQSLQALELYTQVRQLSKEYLELEKALAACKSY